MDQPPAHPQPNVDRPAAAHSIDSSLREKVLEHLFVGDLLRCMWRKGIFDIEVLRAEVDRGGYDLVLESNGIVRHVQLKSSHRLSSTNEVDVSMSLLSKPCGCVVWIRFDQETMELGPFLWLGAEPGRKLPQLGEKISRHSKGDSDGYKAERANHRVVRRSKFKVLATMDDVIATMFGDPTATNCPPSVRSES